MRTIKDIIEVVVKAIKKQFTNVKVKSCWLEFFRAKDGDYGVYITAVITDVTYEYDYEDDKYEYRDVPKNLESEYELEIERILPEDEEIDEGTIKDIIEDVCGDFKIEHKDD